MTKRSESAKAWVTAIASLKSQARVANAAPITLAAAAERPQKRDPLGKLSTKWRATQLPRIRSITFPGPSLTSSSLLPRPLNAAKSARVVLDARTGGAPSSTSSNAITTVFTKANRLFKSRSFTEAPSSSNRFVSTPAFLQQPPRRCASAKRAFPRPPKPFSDRKSAGALAFVKPRRRNVVKRASLAPSSSNESSLVRDEDQQQQALKSLEEHHHENNNNSSAVKTGDTLDDLDDTSRHVRRVVFSLLQSAESFEGHVCTRFFERQQQHFLTDSTCPATCRSYLNKVRDCIQDLVQFILSFRLAQLQICLKNDEEPQNDGDDTISCENNSKHVKYAEGHTDVPREREAHVQDAVEAYFFSSTSRFSSLSAQVAKWCAVVATVPHAAAFERKLAQWSALPAKSDDFALSNPRHVESSASVQRAIGSLRAMSTEVAPSRKLERFMDAVRALNDYSTVESPAAGAATVCDADELLPLLIFALCRSRVPTPLVHCAAMQQLCAFSSPYGERVYYLTMFETAVEFVRTHTREN